MDFDIYIKTLTDKRGLEIGGPSSLFQDENILPIYPHIKSLDSCNFSAQTVWEGSIRKGYNFKYDESKSCGYQYILDAVDLGPIEDSKYEFVLSSHALEHIANPIKALREWIRVLKDYGYLLIVAPHRDGTFDHKRPLTLLNHLIDDYSNLIGEDDLSHLDEILKLHDLSMDPLAGNPESFKKRSLENFNNRCLHCHIFDTSSILYLLNLLRLQVCLVNTAAPHHIIVLGQKLPDGQTPENSKHLNVRAPWRKCSPFLTDLLKSVLPDLVYLPQGFAEVERLIGQVLSLAPIEEETKANLLLHLTSIYYQQGKFSEAEEELKKALSLESFNKDLMISLHYGVGSNYEKQGRLNEAIEKFKYVANNEFLSIQFKGRAHFQLGCIYNELGEEDKAKQHFEKCLKFIPDHRKAKEYLAKLLDKL